MRKQPLYCKRAAQCLVTAMFVLLGAHAQAGVFSFTGTFTQDDDVFLLPFELTSAHVVTLRTWSYAGGTNAAGQVIAAGGMDPILSVFDASGILVGLSDDGIGVAVDTVSGSAYDSLLTIGLGAGNYLLALTEYDNFPNGLNFSDGFSEAGQGNFTAAFGCGNPSFCDPDGFARTGNWALDLTNVDSVPEPGSLALMGAGLAGFVVIRRRRASAARLVAVR